MSRRYAATAGCILAITALTLAAVPAGADRGQSVPAQATAPIAAKSSTAGPPIAAKRPAIDPPPGMLEALQRDLELSPAEARARLDNEARLIPIAARLRTSLGPRFGGSWLRAKTAHALVVATTSAADIPQIVAAGAEAEIVSRSLAELSEIKERLDATLPPAQRHVSSVRYVDPKLNKVVVLTSEPIRAQSFVLSSNVDHSAVVVLSSNETPLPLYDLVGGTAYYIGAASRCSVGFSVRKGTQQGFVSAGHCGRTDSATTGFNRLAQGTFRGSVFPGSDYAWVSVNDNWRVTATVDNGRGGTVPVAGAEPAIEGASVCRSGSTTDWHCGRIQQLDATITYPQGSVSQLVRTSVCAEPGDSGGSFISIDQAQGVTSGGSGDCTQGGTTYFQPIDEILTTYGLTLVTTTGATPPTTPPTTPPVTPPASGCTGYPSTYNGTLTTGQSAYQPRNLYYRSDVTGVHSGCLDGPDGADFDLYLQKWNGQGWPTVATSDGTGPDETITYTGTPGYYRYRVFAAAGSGAYTAASRTP